MSYYPTIEDDLTRAKEILAKGKPPSGIMLQPNQAMIDAVKNGGTIYGADVYAAYKLLESFVAIIEGLQQDVQTAEAELARVKASVHDAGVELRLLGVRLANGTLSVEDLQRLLRPRPRPDAVADPLPE